MEPVSSTCFVLFDIFLEIRGVGERARNERRTSYLLGDESIWLAHQGGGNAARFSRNVIRVMAGDEWPARMLLGNGRLTILIWPLLLRYGYLGHAYGELCGRLVQ